MGQVVAEGGRRGIVLLEFRLFRFMLQGLVFTRFRVRGLDSLHDLGVKILLHYHMIAMFFFFFFFGLEAKHIE